MATEAVTATGTERETTHGATFLNNAGICVYGNYHETDAAIERSVLDLNVVALTEPTKRVVPGMVERGHGRSLNVASTAAVYPSPGAAIYAATKAYVLSYSVALAAGKTVAVSGRTSKLLCRLPRLLSWSRVTKLAADYWNGGKWGVPLAFSRLTSNRVQ